MSSKCQQEGDNGEEIWFEGNPIKRRIDDLNSEGVKEVDDHVKGRKGGDDEKVANSELKGIEDKIDDQEKDRVEVQKNIDKNSLHFYYFMCLLELF